ncbi:MAG TPA: aldo/keto reductase [Longimicrobiales bacterium]|nr:aldo/keto reductase [Longimicrobiales bacterium]
MRTRITRRAALGRMGRFAVGGWLGNRMSSATIERPIPKTGERLPVIGLGTWQTFDVAGSTALRPLEQVLQQFVRLGGRVIDSSPMYGRAEAVTGALATRLELHDRLFLATKVWTRGEQAGVRQLETSLTRLRVHTVDLVQVHNLMDADVHLKTLATWKKNGRIRYIGITHYQESAHDELERRLTREDIDFVQFNYSLATRAAERRLLAAASEHQVAVLINRPFEAGEMFARVRGKPLPGWAAEIDCQSWSQIFLKYIVSHPAVTCVIPATSNPRHLEDNMHAGTGRLPDAALRRRMVTDWQRL